MADRTSTAMTDAPDREFEIVLGNKQLFSLLFIVFVLLGVFFAMGYLMGRNTLPVDTAAAPRSGTVDTQAPSPVSDKPAAVETPATPPSSEPAGVATPNPERTAEQKKTASTPEPVPTPLTVVEPKPGQTFLQVSAINRPEAELLVEVLQKKGFRAILAPGPKENIFRVLVGPENDDAELAKVRTQLEQSGFKPIPRRY